MQELLKRRSIKNWATDEKPREKLLEKGRNSLSNAELLAIILRTGTRDASALHLAQSILSSVDNNLNALASKSIPELQQFPGIGLAKATEIVATMELARRTQQNKEVGRPKVRSSRDAFLHIQPFLKDLHHEEFYAIYLSRSNSILRTVQISKGGISGTVADGKLIFNYGLESKASGIILAHNHPSGNLQPSNADVQLTESLKKFGGFIDVQILDHLIIAGNNYFSFADEGRL